MICPLFFTIVNFLDIFTGSQWYLGTGIRRRTDGQLADPEQTDVACQLVIPDKPPHLSSNVVRRNPNAPLQLRKSQRLKHATEQIPLPPLAFRNVIKHHQ